MLIQIALIVSVVLQFGAFIITISLVQKTRFIVSWILISVGFLLMAVRRLSELIYLTSDQFGTMAVLNAWIAVVISMIMFIASFYIRQIFTIQNQLEQVRKENEAKVLSAIIQTEEIERKRFANELHDGLGPILSSIKMAISAIDKNVIDLKNRTIVEKAEYAVDNAIISVKEISNQLSPHLLERYGLEKAVKTFADSIIAKTKPEVFYASDFEGKRFDIKIELVLYRIIGELFTNTLKYAKASRVEVYLFSRNMIIEMIYTDNGVGFDEEAKIVNGLGLANIQSRVKSLDGSIEQHTGINKGFFMKIILPI